MNIELQLNMVNTLTSFIVEKELRKRIKEIKQQIADSHHATELRKEELSNYLIGHSEALRAVVARDLILVVVEADTDMELDISKVNTALRVQGYLNTETVDNYDTFITTVFPLIINTITF